MATKTKKPDLPPLENLGSIITYTRGGTSYCLGYLMDFKDKGVWDATWGRVPVTPEQAKAHNELYDKANVAGLDNQCQVGQGSVFYVNDGPLSASKTMTPPVRVNTFLGTTVSEGDVRVTAPKRGKYLWVEFDRKGRTFRGRWHRYRDDSVFFERVR